MASQSKPKPAAVKTDMELVQGEWELAGFKTDPTAKGTIVLNSDYSFTGTMDSEKAKKAGKQPKDNTFCGKFALSRQTALGQNTLFLDLTISKLGGKPAGSGAGMRLSYDPKGNVLTDLLIVYYARPSEVNAVKKKLDSLRKDAK